MLRRNILKQHLKRLIVDRSCNINLTRGFEFHREARDPFEFIRQLESQANTDDAASMPRRSKRIAGDRDNEKNETQPQLYNEPPHKLVEGDERTFPPKDVDLSAMWVYQIVRCHFISQEIRYQQWPSVFPSKEPLRSTWTNKGLPAKLWSDARMKWVLIAKGTRYEEP